ncbi:MAG: hypothetical protein ACKVUS_18955 [Saprospiraceae bacterium]
MKNSTLTLLFCCVAAIMPAQQIWHVSHAAVGANNGNTWADAFTDLQSALGAADYGDQIWVAKGTYFPTDSTDRKISFDLPRGVGLYGGFAGDETALAQRNADLHITTLSGDIGATDVRTDNSYHVVYIYGGDGNTILDGFAIAQGYAPNSGGDFPDEYGGGVLVLADAVWPVTTPLISHCRFEQNRAGSGGGLACIGDDAAICSPDIRHCRFERNRAQSKGGAMYKVGRNRSDRAFWVYDCDFESNYCAALGGGIAIYAPTDTVRITKCTFKKDTAIEAGGAHFWSGTENVRYEVDSCHFFTNYTSSASPALAHIFPGYVPVEKIELIVRNTAFFFNKSYLGHGGGITSEALSRLALHRVQVEQCLFHHNYSQNGGAGIFIQGGGLVYTEASVDRCGFLDNQTGASSVAGAFYYRGFGAQLVRNQNTITNSVFMFNDGAIASLGGSPGITHTRVANCSFYQNGAIPFVKYWGEESNPVDLVMTMQILNSIIWEPQTEGVHRLFYNNDPVNFTLNDYLVEHSLVHLPACAYNGVDPCGEGMVYDTWPGYVDPDFGTTLDIEHCSPPHNQGSNLVADTFGLTKDYYGYSRVVADTVDMGSYEFPGPCITDTEAPLFALLPVGIRVLQNPTKVGDLIRVELFAPVPENLHIQLLDANGNMVWEKGASLPASVPSLLSIPSSRLSPGFYYVRIMDEKGRYRTEKVAMF